MCPQTKPRRLTGANPSEGHGVGASRDEELSVAETVRDALSGIVSTVGVAISNNIRGDSDHSAIKGDSELVDAGLIVGDLLCLIRNTRVTPGLSD